MNATKLKLCDIHVVSHQDVLQRPLQFVHFVLPIIHVIYPWEPPVNMHVLRNGLFEILDDARKDICTPNFSKYGRNITRTEFEASNVQTKCCKPFQHLVNQGYHLDPGPIFQPFSGTLIHLEHFVLYARQISSPVSLSYHP